jgi:hypothetical protein
MLLNAEKGEAKVFHRICPYHRIHPGEPFAGCTCSSSYYLTHGRRHGKVKGKRERKSFYLEWKEHGRWTRSDEPFRSEKGAMLRAEIIGLWNVKEFHIVAVAKEKSGLEGPDTEIETGGSDRRLPDGRKRTGPSCGGSEHGS